MKTISAFPVIVGTVVEVNCPPGHTLAGDNTITCIRDVSFKIAERPTCTKGLNVNKIFCWWITTGCNRVIDNQIILISIIMSFKIIKVFTHLECKRSMWIISKFTPYCLWLRFRCFGIDQKLRRKCERTLQSSVWTVRVQVTSFIAFNIQQSEMFVIFAGLNLSWCFRFGYGFMLGIISSTFRQCPDES